jgi:hypothetical protein
MKPQEAVLRELCAWFEWSAPPNLGVAGVLQGAADAVKVDALSVEAAAVLIAVWRPFVGVEAHVGNQPAKITVARTDTDLERAIVSDFRRMIAAETNPAKRVHMTQLMEKQIRNFAEGKR